MANIGLLVVIKSQIELTLIFTYQDLMPFTEWNMGKTNTSGTTYIQVKK